MKTQIILEIPRPEGIVELSASGSCDPSSVYGVEIISDLSPTRRRGFISREAYHSGRYFVRSMDGLTEANYWPKLDDVDLRGVIFKCLNFGHKVYQFDDWKDLLFWILEA